MVFRLVKSIHHLTGIVGLGLLALVGCGSEAPPSEPSTSLPGPEAEGAQAELEAIGVVTGSFQDGHLSFGAVQPTSGAPGVSPQGFGTFTQSKVTFSTAAGDGVQTGTCSATQYCGTVSLTNNTGVAMQNTFVE
ncbi:MAG TPA: hypothetical protein VGC79_36480, partial [Polyangiaceae bacterium]